MVFRNPHVSDYLTKVLRRCRGMFVTCWDLYVLVCSEENDRPLFLIPDVCRLFACMCSLGVNLK